jgi:hypothetical protein
MGRRCLEESLDLVSRLGPLKVTVTGGEPTLHPDFFDACSSLCLMGENMEAGLAVVLESYGSFLDQPKTAAKVLELSWKWGVDVRIRTRPCCPTNLAVMGSARLKGITKKVSCVSGFPSGDEVQGAGQARSLFSFVHEREARGLSCGISVLASGEVLAGSRIVGRPSDSLDRLFEGLKSNP